jgi:hypothetical protein
VSQAIFGAWVFADRLENENLATSYKDLIADKASRHRTLCGCLVQAMCQWTGVNVK